MIKRRSFLEGVLAGTILQNSGLISGLQNFGLIARAQASPSPTDAPDWLDEGPIVAVSSYGHPIFRRRMGTNPMWEEEVYRKQQSEETVQKLKNAGVTLAIIPFFLGCGLTAEEEEIADSQKLAALLRRYKIRVGVYVGSTIFYEMFLLEKPEAAEWFVPDFLGRPVIYSNQTFRKRVYFMHPGYREYMKRVLRVAIERLQVDLIHFDNTSMQAERPIFQHPLAISDFRTYLQTQYSADVLKQRFGFSDMRYVEPPRSDAPLATIDDPLFQVWAGFRCHQLSSYYAEMKSFIRGLNPKVGIAANPHLGISGYNTVWTQGVHYPSLAPQMDIIWNEEGDYAGVDANQILISNIRSYKMSAKFNRKTLAYTARTFAGDGTFSNELPAGIVQMAESFVFNRQSAGNVGGPFAGSDMTPQALQYLRFFHDNFALYRGVQSVAEVAVLHSYASMAFNNDRAAVSFMLFTQALIQSRVPFDLIFDEDLKALDKYRVLVLADQECLDDDKLDLIRTFVHQGGGLVATEHSSLYTEWRRRRSDFGLNDLFQLQAPRWKGLEPDEVLKVGTVRHEIGSGRSVYISEVLPAIEKPSGAAMNRPYWKLPTNWGDLIDSVQWAAGRPLMLDVTAPSTVVAELLRHPDTGKLLLHLINYDADQTPHVRDINVRLHGVKIPTEVFLVSPDAQDVHRLSFTTENGAVAFIVPELKVYSIVSIS